MNRIGDPIEAVESSEFLHQNEAEKKVKNVFANVDNWSMSEIPTTQKSDDDQTVISTSTSFVVSDSYAELEKSPERPPLSKLVRVSIDTNKGMVNLKHLTTNQAKF